MYDADSFFTLTVWGQIGLAILSLVFALLALVLMRVLVWHKAMILRPFLWGVVFISFVWLSPQGYYTYYRLIFDGLPAQSVIKSPPPLQQLFALMTFSGPANLSAHSTGVLGWLLLLAAFWPHRKKRTPPS